MTRLIHCRARLVADVNRLQLLGRCATAVAAATIIAGLVAIPAAARPDPGDPTTPRFSSHDSCQLSRIDTQLVRCDDLTGGGVPAPVWVPEL
jgi:hypothetical protein